VKLLWLSVVVVALDQASKWLALSRLELHQPVALLPGLNLTLMYNTGAAFSLLDDAGGWQRWFFVALAGAASAVIVVWLHRLRGGQPLLALALALILGGAVGNLIDRLVLGYVVDFIDVYWRGYHWPAFNLADSAITVGAVLFVADTVLGPRPPPGRDV